MPAFVFDREKRNPEGLQRQMGTPAQRAVMDALFENAEQVGQHLPDHLFQQLIPLFDYQALPMFHPSGIYGDFTGEDDFDYYAGFGDELTDGFRWVLGVRHLNGVRDVLSDEPRYIGNSLVISVILPDGTENIYDFQNFVDRVWNVPYPKLDPLNGTPLEYCFMTTWHNIPTAVPVASPERTPRAAMPRNVPENDPEAGGMKRRKKRRTNRRRSIQKSRRRFTGLR